MPRDPTNDDPSGQSPEDDGNELIDVRQAQVSTAQITIDTIKIGHKQVTLSTFRQLLDQELVDATAIKVAGPIWGKVNYFWKDCHPAYGKHLHIVWQRGSALRRAGVPNIRNSMAARGVEQRAVERAQSFLHALATIRWSIRALTEDWLPTELPGYNEPLTIWLPELRVSVDIALYRRDAQRTLKESALLTFLKQRKAWPRESPGDYYSDKLVEEVAQDLARWADVFDRRAPADLRVDWKSMPGRPLPQVKAASVLAVPLLDAALLEYDGLLFEAQETVTQRDARWEELYATLEASRHLFIAV